MPLILHSARQAASVGFSDGRDRVKRFNAEPENVESLLLAALGNTPEGANFLDDYKQGFRAGVCGKPSPAVIA